MTSKRIIKIVSALSLVAAAGTTTAYATDFGGDNIVHDYKHVTGTAPLSTLQACNDRLADAVKNTNAASGVSRVKAGQCHYNDYTVNGKSFTGYTYDETYSRTSPIWPADTQLSDTPWDSVYGQSFKRTGSADSQVSATVAQDQAVDQIGKSSYGSPISAKPTPVLNALTKKWDWEVDYSAILAASTGDTTIASTSGKTTASLGIKTPVPTTPTTTAKDAGITTPGQASMGWKDGKAPTTPITVTPPAKITTPTTTNNSGTVITTTTPTPEKIGIQGIDVSGYTNITDWNKMYQAGDRFAIVKATEGRYYKNPKFSAQYSGTYNANIIHGAYDFAIPSASTGADEADYFIQNGGGWSADGKTLPGTIDAEWNPYGASCYGLSQTQMTNWLRSFVTEYQAKTGVKPMIYTNTIWWNSCVGSSADFHDVKLWAANYNTTVGKLPASFTAPQTIWQNDDGNGIGYDHDIYNGTLSGLQKFAMTGN